MKKLILLLSIPLMAYAHPDWSRSGIKGPTYAQWLKLFDTWTQKYPQYVSTYEYGKTKLGRPMKLVMIMKAGFFPSRPTVLITALAHGNEFLGVEDKLPESILQRMKTSENFRDFFNEGGAIVYVPVLNPDGYEAQSRLNSNGTDINRDWQIPLHAQRGFRENETRLLAQKLIQLKSLMGLSYKLTLDYHCCAGALLRPWSYKVEELPPKIAAIYNKFSALANDKLGIEVSTTSDTLGYAPVGTSKDYFYAAHGAISFTYEGRQYVEKYFYSQHVAFWEEALGFLTKGRLSSPQFDANIMTAGNGRRNLYYEAQ